MSSLSAGARFWRAIAIFLVVVLVLLVVADRVGVLVAEHIAGNTLKTSQHLDSAPDVDIDGVPFLTQLAEGDYDKITVTATDVPIGSSSVSLPIDRLHVELDKVTVNRSFTRFHADTATATATIGYAALSSALGVTVSYLGNGRIRASKKITILGQTVTPTVTATPAIADGVLSFGSAQINGAGALGGEAAAILKAFFGVPIPLSGIPFGIKVRSAGVTSAGLVINLSGADLTYVNQGQS